MNRKAQITLDDIAKKLKVSKVTVSKALRDHPDISKETAELVKKTAVKLGYTPNYIARNLSSKRSNTIGVVVPKIAHFFFSSVIEAIYDTAFNNNYEIILTVAQEDPAREIKHIESLLAMRVDGLIISITQHTKDKTVFEKILRHQIPLTFVDRVLNLPGANTVTVDDRGGSREAVEYAISLGYTKIAHFAGYQNINIGKRRFQGFKDAMKKYNLPVNPNWVIFGGFGEEDGYKGFMRLYKSGNLPELIFAVNHTVSLGIFTAAEETGVKIPDDLDIICFGNSELSRFIKPTVSYINQPTDKLGAAAVELTIQNIKNKDHQPKHIEFPTNFILRETCIKRRDNEEVLI